MQISHDDEGITFKLHNFVKITFYHQYIFVVLSLRALISTHLMV